MLEDHEHTHTQKKHKDKGYDRILPRKSKKKTPHRDLRTIHRNTDNMLGGLNGSMNMIKKMNMTSSSLDHENIVWSMEAAK